MANKTKGFLPNEETKHQLAPPKKTKYITPYYLEKSEIERVVEFEKNMTEHEIVKYRWADYLRTGVSVSHEDVKAWADSLRESADDPV